MFNPSVETISSSSRLLHAEHDFALGASRDMFFVLWQDETTHQGIEKLRNTFDQFSHDRRKDAALITVVVSGAKPPQSDVRRELALWLDSASDKLVVSAVVFEGTGFVAAMVRGVVTGLAMLAKPRCPHRVFETVEQAGAWFQEVTLDSSNHFGRDFVVARTAEFRNALSRGRSSRQNTLPEMGFRS